MALELVEMAAECGFSAAKFQTFTADQVYVNDPRTGNYLLMGKKIPIYELHKSLEMPIDWIPILKDKCDSLGIEFFSAPIGISSLNQLVKNQLKVLKISSYECTNLPFLEEVARTRIPTIMSTGACNLKEIERAVEIFENANSPVVLLHCLTKYPAEFKSANLAVIKTLRSAFNVPVGFSDNGFINESRQIDYLEIPSEAAKSGADVFEIHVTLDRNLPGPDHGFATEPNELFEMVQIMKKIRKELLNGNDYTLNPLLQGSSIKKMLPEEKYVRDFAFKCIFACQDISPGEKITPDKIAVLRPGEGKRGLEPEFYNLITTKAYAKKRINKNDPITWDEIL